ncbi:DEAD/DEAH box helicase family protein [Vibrio sp. TMPB1044]|uniref:DEAD/DEAH box helicase family protein n=1 Tax=Vibrio sp. TMPB1044 TaxID=3051822 RepID=UPI00255B51DB|nr:DEAD/DEAH box helicase family protein [Vibrio sp. TMPB1044]MDL5029785.1 DEAD/DEAH box helicase family protein [Vibrio sp. TMPB1044]MDN5209913.1 DEAD/DEAH box helicase family protein [Vibrio sp. TMPB1044]
MSFVDITFPDNSEYSSDSDHLPLEFYLQVFPKSKTVYLKLGYFSSSALRVLAYGFAQFIYNGGSIKIVTNHFLYNSDKELLEPQGRTEEDVQECFYESLESLKEHLTSESEQFYNCLKYLVGKGRLEIIPVMLIPNRMAHYKQGIFTDHHNNDIFIDGSCNFTANGILENGENISIYRSWGDKFEHKKVSNKKVDIKTICERKSNKYKYLREEQIVSSILELGEDKSINELLSDEFTLVGDIIVNENNYLIEKYKKDLENLIREEELKPKFPFKSKPRSYQIDAYKNWLENDKKGIFAMATGTGKTITSLNCLLNEYKKDEKYQSIILVPSKILLNQWFEEVSLFNFKNIYRVSSEYKWKDSLNTLTTNLMFDSDVSFVLICTYATFSDARFDKYRSKFPKETILIADEAHNIGGAKMKALLPKLNFQRRIALSATPKRKFDEEGNAAIEAFFNSTDPYTFVFSMEKAIRDGILCNYNYYPIIVQLTDEELERYIEITKKLSKFFDGDSGQLKLSDIVEKLLLERKRIIHKASNKKIAFKNILVKEFERKNNLKYSFVYVPEGNDSDGVNIMSQYLSLLEDVSPSTRALAYTSNTQSKDEVMAAFESGLIESLFSMKCLDEGVDIPRAEMAIFCSSTGNPRQFIQRRGRVLRKHSEKNHATIYDLVVIPSLDSNSSTFSYEKNLIREELVRVIYFASLAENYYTAMSTFEELADFYDFDLYAMQYELGEH